MTTVVKNKKAFFNYHILETMEAGIALTGREVKGIRSGKASLSGAFVSLKNGEVYLVNSIISPYQPKNTPEDYDAKRDRKLLLKKGEINRLAGKTQEKGTTVIPLRIYKKKNFLKVELGVAKGKKKYDKRETIKKREVDRDIRRRMKR